MLQQIKITDIEIDTSMLLTRQELLEYLKEYGGNDRILADIRERNYSAFGNELMWRYPISDGKHTGTYIIVIQEGFISLPYDEIDAEDYELLELDDAAMFDEDSLEIFIGDWRMFSDDLLEALSDMLKIEQNKPVI